MIQAPRQAEHINLHADLGDPYAQATGVVDLVHASANLEYAAEASAMVPRADLSWQQLHVRGNWQGTLAAAVAAGQVQALPAAAGQWAIAALNASLRHVREISVSARVSKARRHRVPRRPVAGATGGSGFDSAGTGDASV